MQGNSQDGDFQSFKANSLKLSVHRARGNALHCEVDGRWPISRLKALIQGRTGVAINGQELTLAGKHLDYGQSIVQAGVREGDTIKLVVTNSDPPVGFFQVSVKDLTGKTHVMWIAASWTGLQFKNLVRDVTGVPSNQQRLIFSGKQIENNRLLSLFGVRHEATVHLVLRLGGD